MLTYFANGRRCAPAHLHAHDYGGVTVYGLSTDEKPDFLSNASVFYEMDTGKVYLYDGEGGQWFEQ